MSLSCLAANPYRVPNWRWERAINVLDGQMFRPSRTRDGILGYKWIRAAMQFKLAHDRCTTDAERCGVATRFPDIFWAYWLNANRSPMRSTVEAYLLTGMEPYEIGFATGIPAESIEAYENIFFDVRDKLQHPPYILHCVIGPALQDGLTEREYDTLWKLYGYFYGRHMVDALASKCANPTRCLSADQVNATWQEDAINTMKMKSAVATKTIAINGHTQMDLINAFTKFTEIERLTGTGGGSDQLLVCIQQMFEKLPFYVAGRDPKNGWQVAHSRLSSYDKTGTELNYEETVLMGSGARQLPVESLDEVSFDDVPALAQGGADDGSN